MLTSGNSFRLLTKAEKNKIRLSFNFPKETLAMAENKFETNNAKETENKKRMFLKLAGVVGLSAFATLIVPKKAEALVFGSTPASNVVGVKDSANLRINPAEKSQLPTALTALGNLKVAISEGSLSVGNVGIKKIDGSQINPASEEGLAAVGVSVNDQGLWMLRKITSLLKPLGMVTGAGSNRLSVDVNSGAITASIAATQTLGTVTTVGTVSSMTNLVNIGNVNGFSMVKDSARNAYANSIRSKISF